MSGNAQTGWQAYSESLDLLDSTGLSDRNARALKAFILLHMGDTRVGLTHEQGGKLLEQALAFYRALDDRWSIAQTLSCLGEVHLLSSKFGRARQLYEESLAIRRSLGDQIGIAESLRALGNVNGNEGRLEEGERLSQQAFALYRELGEHAAVASGLHGLACLYVWSGRFAEACPLLEQAAAIHKDRGMQAAYAWNEQILAWSQMNLGQYKRSLDRLQIALSLFREHADRFGMGMALLGLSEFSLVKQDYVEARRLSRESASVFGELGVKDHVGLAVASLAHAEWGLGHFCQAHEHLHRALRLAPETKAFALAVTGLLTASLLCLEKGETERAVELYAVAATHPYIGNSRFRHEIAGQHVAAAADQLSADVVAAARERGRAREMWSTVDELLKEE
jgi:tetratricopeptide (TPR) repeat protein